jgi:hypothetical protein
MTTTFDGTAILEDSIKEKYLESIILSINELDKFLVQKNNEYYSKQIFFHKRIAELYNHLRLASLENNLEGGSTNKIQVSTTSGLPMLNELNWLGNRYTLSESKLISIVKEQLAADHASYDRKYDSQNFLKSLSVDAVKTMLKGNPANLQRIILREFLDNTRMQQLAKENTKESALKIRLLKDSQVVETTKISDKDDKTALYELEMYKISRASLSWCQYSIQFEYTKPKFFSKLIDNDDGSWTPKGELTTALSQATIEESAPRSVYLKLAKVNGVQPTYISIHSLGPFYHANGLTHLKLSELFLKRPDAFVLQYSRESVGMDTSWDLSEFKKAGFKQHPDQFVMVCPSEIGIDFQDMIGNNKEIDVVEIQQKETNNINKKYSAINPRWASEYKM